MIPGMIKPFLIGFATTFKHMFKKANTVNYPAEKVPVFPKWRGKQVLMRDENGLEKCVACGLCAVACPADAIYLEPAENDGDDRSLLVPLVTDGEVVGREPLSASRDRHAAARAELPQIARQLQHGEQVIPTIHEGGYPS